MAKKMSWSMGSLLVAIISLTVSAPGALSPVKITDVSVERLNPIAADKFQKTDVFVFSTTFTLSNPQKALARVSDFKF